MPRIETMTAPFKTIEGTADIAGSMREIGRHAKAAARVLALAPAAQKNQALAAIADAIRAGQDDILAANAEDIAEAEAAGATSAFLDRLGLDPKRPLWRKGSMWCAISRTRSVPSWRAGRGRTE
jgi:glutamate-5-semialdehyde dehydrogenase